MPTERMTIAEYRARTAKKAGKKRGEPNKTEAAFASEVLEARRLVQVSTEYRYEPLTLRLVDGVKYTPDFVEWMPDNTLVMYEVKGFWREAARIRIKVAAEIFPMFKFVAVQKLKKKEGGGWKYEDF